MRSLLIVLLCLCLSPAIFAASGDLGASNGANGSETSPWLIEDFDDFNAFCNDSSKWASGQYTRLEANIDLDPALPSRVIYTQAPIAPDTDSDTGSTFDGTAYAGSFDGNGQVITNLQINGTYYCGLFGKTELGSEISNLGIENASITGSGGNLGGLCGENSGTISNCYAASSVSGGDYSYYLGGLCGVNYRGSISNCYASGSVSGGSNSEIVGGLCGKNWYGTISSCYATGTVSGGDYSDYLGGLCGYNREGTISNSYATGSVSGDAYLGGLCGKNWYGSISNCYAAGSVSGDDSSYYLGGLCGYNDSGTIYNCYAAGSVSGIGHLGGLCGSNYGTISNCYATGSVSGGDYSRRLGGLCGYNDNGTISNCYAAGSVSGGINSEYLGGLCGYNDSGTIYNCYAAGSVSGIGHLGGLCGRNRGSISNCYATGSVSGRDYCEYLGGLCGRNSGTISNCYAAGSVSGGINSDYLGGLCGYNYGTISNCYAASSVTGGDYSRRLGGLCGYQYGDSSEISNSFWDTQTSGLSIGVNQDSTRPGTVTNLLGKPTAEMQDINTFLNAGWDFVSELANGTNEIWQMSAANGYPLLSSLNGYTPVSLDGDGSQNYPYLISNALELGAIYHYDNSDFYKLSADIELSGIQWSTAVIPLFKGHFDGDGHVIYNLTISGGEHLGLFGKVDVNAEITNLGLENISITGSSSYLGGLCGVNYRGTISNCYAAGSVSGGDSSYYLGGLCGWNYSGTISNCYAAGSVSGNSRLGGLCGVNTFGTISNCYAAGSVSGNSRLGGLCGYQSGNAALILNCFWDTQTSGLSIGVIQDSSYPRTVINLQGLTTTEMQDINTFLNADWDFVSESANGTEDLWHMPYQATGYPMLFFQRDIPGDLTGSYGVNLEDLGYLSKSWQDSYTITDLQTLAQFWLEGK